MTEPKFKVGQRVVLKGYDSEGLPVENDNGMITTITGNIATVHADISGTVKVILSQLRRLKIKKLREIWVSKEEISLNDYPTGERTIRFVEAKEK